MGPAAQFYATIPKGVIGLGAGAYGETGRGIQEYHALIANHASTIRDSAVSSTTPYYHPANTPDSPESPRFILRESPPDQPVAVDEAPAFEGAAG